MHNDQSFGMSGLKNNGMPLTCTHCTETKSKSMSLLTTLVVQVQQLVQGVTFEIAPCGPWGISPLSLHCPTF